MPRKYLCERQKTTMNSIAQQDPGAHYRYEYRGIKLDPFRIAHIYGMTDNALFTILKKCLRAGRGGHKNLRQDLLDIINAAQRRLEMLDEDKGLYDA